MDNVEEWRKLPSNENYLVSNLGRVQVLPRISKTGRKLKGRMLEPYLGNRGRLLVCIKGKRRTVHQLVCEAFLFHKPCGYKLVVDHINNIPTDNRLINLQLITNRENTSKDRKDGSSKYVGVNWNNQNKKWVSQITINGKQNHLGYFNSEQEAAKYYQDALICVEEGRVEDIKFKKPNFSSKYVGVHWYKPSKKWMSQIVINGKQKYLGLFNCELLAHQAYQTKLNQIKNG